ncbi:MAG TPA: MerR family transcriptional regulator [Gammaproteobacteria bacterium]|nr:MerR family transcriptional regulator [Gammaproteobacteria bacterium]
MTHQSMDLLSGTVLEDSDYLSLSELCQSCSLPAEQVLKMVAQGIIEPQDSRHRSTQWRFSGDSLIRVHTVVRLRRDLGVNLAGAALAIELLDEIKVLRQALARR